MVKLFETFNRVENYAVQWCSPQFPPAPSVTELVRWRVIWPFENKTGVIRVAAAAAAAAAAC